MPYVGRAPANKTIELRVVASQTARLLGVAAGDWEQP